MRTLWLGKGEDRRLRAGHLWIFGNEVDGQRSPLTDFSPGEGVTVRDARGGVIGSAFVNPHSLICARLYSRHPDRELDEALLRERLTAALALRQRLFDVPYYRLCHGEGDLLPGLVVDRFGDHLTVQLGTAGMEARREQLAACLHELLHPSSILWDNDLAARGLEQLSRQSVLEGPVPRRLDIPENGCRFTAPLLDGQKTGWFYDQRANRREAARYARGADVPRPRLWSWLSTMRAAMRPSWPVPRPLRACAAMPLSCSRNCTKQAVAFPSSVLTRRPSSSAARIWRRAWPPTAGSMPWRCTCLPPAASW